MEPSTQDHYLSTNSKLQKLLASLDSVGGDMSSAHKKFILLKVDYFLQLGNIGKSHQYYMEIHSANLTQISASIVLCLLSTHSFFLG